MKKTWLFLLILPLLCISCINPLIEQLTTQSEESPFIDISNQDNLTLTHLNAQKQDFSYQDGGLMLGDKSANAKQKQLFLIHNRSRNPIILDFPQGHVGATAGIMQMIQPDEWYAYLYIKGKDYRPADSSTGKLRHIRPTWTCQQGNPDYEKYSSCKNYLDIYSLDYNLNQLKTAQNIIDYKLLQILTYNNRTKWLTRISYPSIRSLLMAIHVITPKKHT